MLNKKWNDSYIENQTDKVVIVTGSTSGLGLETARILAKKKATVIIAARNPGKIESALTQIRSDNPNSKVRAMTLDLADLATIKTFTDQFKRSFSRLDLLINNAGVMVPPYQKTKDGFELQMGTNHLGHFALTGQLINLITDTPKSRIVNVSSLAHKVGNINFDDLNWEHKPYKKWNAYGDSKLANLYFTFGLQQRLIAQGAQTIATAAHPGWTATELQRHTGMTAMLNHLFAQPPSMGVLPTLYAACGKDVQGGQFFGPSGFMEMKGYPERINPIPRATDPTRAEVLFNISENLTGVRF